MSYILDISTAVPEFPISNQEFVEFYANALESIGENPSKKKLTFLSAKTKIQKRYSCIEDFSGKKFELFVNDKFNQSVEERLSIYKSKILSLSKKAIDPLLRQTRIQPNEITHLITVSCTGMFAPGMEFLLAEEYGLQKAEKLALNFLGCYAAVKALKHASYIAESNPNACILIISAELCSLHFSPSLVDEDIIANLLFADGAAAAIVCGNESRHLKDKVALRIDSIASACFPDSADLMTWDISSSAFRMYLSRHIVKTIKANIGPVIKNIVGEELTKMDYWAIHPGGVKIVDAVQEELGLSDDNVSDSRAVLSEYGNMSSATILFILEKILTRIKMEEEQDEKKIFACAFGPGISMEIINLSSISKTLISDKKMATEYAF